jgi:hypothetical protein
MNDEAVNAKNALLKRVWLSDGLGKLYGERNPMNQGIYYLRHIQAMTDEGLHSKADIAAELGHRDIEIDRLLGIIVMAHDRLLRGDDDKELLVLLEAGWSERPNVKLTGRGMGS